MRKAALIYVGILLIYACGNVVVRNSPEQTRGNESINVSEEIDGLPLSEPTIVLRRGMCLGSCPAYEVRIFTDGSVEYRGDHFVKKTGHAYKRITQDQVSALRASLEISGFLELPEENSLRASGCFIIITDQPSVSIEYQDGHRTKLVNHDNGCLGPPTAILNDLAKKIDDVVGTVEWVGTSEERQRIW